MQCRFKMEYRLFTIVRYNYSYRDYNKQVLTSTGTPTQKQTTTNTRITKADNNEYQDYL